MVLVCSCWLIDVFTDGVSTEYASAADGYEIGTTLDRWSKSVVEPCIMANLNEMDSTLLGLPTDERARLARLLLVSLDEQIDDDVDATWKAEAERRFCEYKNGQVETIHCKEVMREARQALL